MKRRLREAQRRVDANPVLRSTLRSLRPSVTLWGAVGIVLFLILPEIVGFVWGVRIATWAHARMLDEASVAGRKLFWLLEWTFKDGGSWLNLWVGVAMLLWWVRIRKARRSLEVQSRNRP